VKENRKMRIRTLVASTAIIGAALGVPAGVGIATAPPAAAATTYPNAPAGFFETIGGVQYYVIDGVAYQVLPGDLIDVNGVYYHA
jgi:hypothetical protein